METVEHKDDRAEREAVEFFMNDLKAVIRDCRMEVQRNLVFDGHGLHRSSPVNGARRKIPHRASETAGAIAT